MHIYCMHITYYISAHNHKDTDTHTVQCKDVHVLKYGYNTAFILIFLHIKDACSPDNVTMHHNYVIVFIQSFCTWFQMPILHYILSIQLYIFSGSDVSANSGFDSKLYIHSIMYNTYYTMHISTSSLTQCCTQRKLQGGQHGLLVWSLFVLTLDIEWHHLLTVVNTPFDDLLLQVALKVVEMEWAVEVEVTVVPVMVSCNVFTVCTTYFTNSSTLR